MKEEIRNKKKRLATLFVLFSILSILLPIETVNANPSITVIYVGGSTTNKAYEYYISNLTKKAESASYGGAINAIEADDTYLYVAGATTQKVYQYWRSNLTKKAESAVYGGTITTLTQDETYIYAAGATTRKVYQYWKSNLTKKAETIGYGGDINTIIADTTYIYAGGQITQRIYQFWKTNMTKKAQTVDIGASIMSMKNDSTYLYSGNGNQKVLQYWKTNLTKKAETGAYGGIIYAMDIDDTYIYAGGATTRKVYQYWKSNLTKKAETADYGGTIRAVMSYDTYIFAGGASTQKTYQYWKSNMTKKAETAGYGGVIMSIAIEKVYMFIPSPPSAFTAIAMSRFIINLSWVKGSKADYTYIQAKVGSYPSNKADGTNIYNNTGTTYSHTGLSPNQHWYYRAWSWNATQNLWSPDNSSADATTVANNPPTFGIPSPANNSINQTLSLFWNITIQDIEGDSFNWTIQCDNGNTSFANSASNGTKSLFISGLAYSTTYKVWVNATDGYDWRRAWYLFTTNQSPNRPPVLSNEFPVNNSNNVSLSIIWNVTIEDPEGDLFNWTIQCNNSNTNSANGDTNGTKSLVLANLSFLTTYTIWVNATDGDKWVRAWYIFTTRGNRAPIIFNEYPYNNSEIDPLQVIWNVTIQDPDGDDFCWWINCSSGDRNTNDDTNGSKNVFVFYINYSTIYYIWVNVTDGVDWSRSVYIFTTITRNVSVNITQFLPTDTAYSKLYLFLPAIPITLLGCLVYYRRKKHGT